MDVRTDQDFSPSVVHQDGVGAPTDIPTDIFATLDRISRAIIPNGHPFARGLTAQNAEPVMADYLAMSEAFPYVQAGAGKQLWQAHADRNEEVCEAARVTSAVAAFLCWDEIGGYAKALAGGRSALPAILVTADFHSELLRADLEALFAKTVAPNYSAETRQYLACLGTGLASFDPVERVAYMVAFESHAGTMITALWQGLMHVYGERADALQYFVVHVGGEDPGEAYHIQMTSRMIERLVPSNRYRDFFAFFKLAYKTNVEWCATLVARDELSP